MEYDGSLVYYLWLTKISGIGPVTQHALLEELNTPEAVYYASEEKLLRTGMTENRIRLILEARDLDDARQELEQCREQGIFLMTYRDEIYPKELRSVLDLPVLLYGKGKPELFGPNASLEIDFGEKWQPFGPDYVPTELDWWWKDEPLINCPDRRVGVIGARRCTREDKEKCINRVKRIGEDNPGAIIISGGAKGIDGYAHTAAIKNGLRTIAFVGTGPDLCYPREHRELFEQISEQGMILSEYPPGTAAYPSHFPRRNRLIAAWSDEMYVIGAGRNSGTRSTVQYFHKYHKEQGC